MIRGSTLFLLLAFSLIAATGADCQYRQSQNIAPRTAEPASPPRTAVQAVATRAPDTETLLRQTAAGLIGGLAGSLAILLPLAAVDGGDSDDAMTVGALLGYLGGSAVGVQLYSHRIGLRGSWWGTLGGATIGALGGPVLILTVPLGAMVGFNVTPYTAPEPTP
jgi:hypothetical protein